MFVTTMDPTIVPTICLCVVVKEYKIFCYHQSLLYQNTKMTQNKKTRVSRANALVFSFLVFKHIYIFSMLPEFLDLGISIHKLCSEQSVNLNSSIHSNFFISIDILTFLLSEIFHLAWVRTNSVFWVLFSFWFVLFIYLFFKERERWRGEWRGGEGERQYFF